MTKLKKAAAAAVLLITTLALTATADARHRYHSYRHRAPSIMRMDAMPHYAVDPNGNWASYAAVQTYSARRHPVQYQQYEQQLQQYNRQVAAANRQYQAELGTTVAHPAGCPWHAFCGCGVSVRIYGHPVRSLFLATNYGRFPPASPGAGMVAYRSGHVMYIEHMLANGHAMVYDPNSGGHLTRVHEHSLAGYRVVNPHVRSASL